MNEDLYRLVGQKEYIIQALKRRIDELNSDLDLLRKKVNHSCKECQAKKAEAK